MASSLWCLKCERAAIRGTRLCRYHSAVLPKISDYQKDEQLSTYKFSIGERVTARYSSGDTITGKIEKHKPGWSTPVYTVIPDGGSLPQIFWEHELTKVPQSEESPYTIAIAAVDAEIQKQEKIHTEARKKISELVQARTTLTDLRRAESKS